ncbi:hypothetical protein BDW67DRAFT_170438 [Aspergillus spinulosporus]
MPSYYAVGMLTFDRPGRALHAAATAGSLVLFLANPATTKPLPFPSSASDTSCRLCCAIGFLARALAPPLPNSRPDQPLQSMFTFSTLQLSKVMLIN